MHNTYIHNTYIHICIIHTYIIHTYIYKYTHIHSYILSVRINVLAAKNLCTTDSSSQTSWPPMILTTSIWPWSMAEWTRRSTYSFNVGSKVHESQLLPPSALHSPAEPKSWALVRTRGNSFFRGIQKHNYSTVVRTRKTNLRTAFWSGTAEYCNSCVLVHLMKSYPFVVLCHWINPRLTNRDTFLKRGRFGESAFGEISFVRNWWGYREAGLESTINSIIKSTLL